MLVRRRLNELELHAVTKSLGTTSLYQINTVSINTNNIIVVVVG